MPSSHSKVFPWHILLFLINDKLYNFITLLEWLSIWYTFQLDFKNFFVMPSGVHIWLFLMIKLLTLNKYTLWHPHYSDERDMIQLLNSENSFILKWLTPKNTYLVPHICEQKRYLLVCWNVGKYVKRHHK